MKKAIIYARKSTDREDKQIQSLEAQLNWCRDYAQSNNFEIIEEIIESKSAKQPGRPWFNKLMLAFSENKAEIIICWQLNRLSRNPIDEGTIKWLTQQWIIKEIHSTDWISNWQNILLMSVHFWMATQYVIDLKKNVLRWLKQKLEKGWICWNVPFWYKNDKNTATAIVIEENAKVVKEIFELRIKGWSYIDIAEHLFKKGIKTKSWKTISKSTIERIIKNDFYIWIMTFFGEKYKWNHTPIISKELFERANKDTKNYKKVSEDEENRFFLKEILYYEWKKMSPYEKKGNIYYKQGFWIKPAINLSQNEILKEFWKIIEIYSIPETQIWVIRDLFKKYAKEIYKENKKQYEGIKRKINEMRERKSKLLDIRLSGVISDEEYKEKSQELVMMDVEFSEELEKINYADNKISQEASELLDLLISLPSLYNNWNESSRCLIIKIIASELILNNKKELVIKENKLFDIIKSLNSTKWWVIRDSNPGPSP